MKHAIKPKFRLRSPFPKKKQLAIMLALLGMILPIVFSFITMQTTIAQTVSSKLFGVHEFNIAAASGVPDRVNQIKQVGAQIVRLPVTWHLMEEGGKGKTADWFWAGLDADVAAAERAGVKLILELGLTPCWASSAPKNANGTCPDNTYLAYPPKNPSDYGDAIARLVQRYKGRVYAWEIYNEPNAWENWKPLPPRPASQNDQPNTFVDLQGARQYAAIVKAAYPKIKAAYPQATVLAGAIAGSDVDYLNTMYDAGVKGFFDALSLHPYTAPHLHLSSSDPKQKRSYGPDECFPNADPKTAKFWCVKVGVEKMRQAMLNRGDDKKIWLTEFGFTSTENWAGVGLQGQADYLKKSIQIIRGWDFVPVAIWYQLVDRYDKDDKEGRFGLFTRAGAIKPAGTAFREMLTTTKPTPISPIGTTSIDLPTFTWTSVPGATQYKVWANDYGTPNVPGKINLTFTPTQAKCATGGNCSVSPGVRFSASGEWWVTAYFSGAPERLSDGAKFSVTVPTKPALIAPVGTIATNRPFYRWKPVPGSTQYLLWVNQYGTPNTPGRVQTYLTPTQAACSATECSYQPTTTLTPGGAEWWVTSIAPNGVRSESNGLYFTVP
jgi:hypothetical protein